MPRPGPRPYECVRRAWHSDRHQPMRGSLIQEIFRVVNEIHCSATKKNKEWQEKLPIVVLKAEEIMYSKANSEAEYMELKTLCERLNDAIDTIIRRDESTETAELLHPCIEAALNLGCTPRRASRSQRHNNPRFYLSPNPHEPITIAPKMSNNTTQHLYPHLLSHKPSIQATNPRFMSHHSAFTTPTILNSVPMCSESSNPVIENNSIPTPLEFPFSSENFHQPGNGQSIAIAMSSLSKPACVYPLYYGLPVQIGGTHSNLQLPKDPNSEVIVASSVSNQNPVEPAEMRVLQDLLSHDGAANASNCISEADLRNATDNPPETDFDLTLRLGVLAAPCAGGEDKLTPEIEDIGSSSSQEDSKLHDLLTDMDKDFHFFSKENAGDPSESCSSRRSHEGGILNTEASNRKRKAHVRECVEDGQFSWQPGLPSTDFFGRMKRSGL